MSNKHQSLCQPFNPFALAWAFSATLPALFLMASYSGLNGRRRAGEKEQDRLGHDNRNDVAKMTPEDEVLLLHIME
jgi:hypothetical protein